MAVYESSISLDIAGIGIIFYSPVFAEHITEDYDYLEASYTSDEQVQAHIQKGTIVGFGTGSPGTFILRFHSGYPHESLLQGSDFRLRLGLNCVGGKVCFRDLYDLMSWYPDCPEDQVLKLEDGIYHVTLCSSLPDSGIIGDHQEIHVYLHPLDSFPRLSSVGIPVLCM